MNHNNLPPPTSPPLLALPVVKRDFEYHFILKKRSFWCYNKYITINKNNDNYIINKNKDENILQIPLHKSEEDIIKILKTCGIQSKALYKLYVMNGDILLSKKTFYNIKDVINHIFITENILQGCKFN